MLPIVYHDDYLVAVHKPSGLLVHRSIVDAHEQRFAVQLLRDQIGRRVYPAHRLDKATSGLLLFALSSEIAAAMGAAFQDGRVRKTYAAIVRGHPPEAGVIDHPLAPVEDEIERTARSGAAPRPAQTHFRRLAVCELPHRVDRYPTSRYALLSLHPITGRRHQLRRHLKHISHPIIGDSSFGKGPHNRLFRDVFGCGRLLLASVELAFAHPVSGEPLQLTAPLAEDFAAVVRGLGWERQIPAAWLRPAQTGSAQTV